MAVSEVKAAQFECDACGKRALVVPEENWSLDDPPSPPDGWFSGTAEDPVVWSRWVACKRSCINKAIKSALDPDVPFN